MYLATSNEKNGLTSTERRADAAAVWAGFPADDLPIVLWQELRLVSHHDDIVAKEPPGTAHLFSGLPIAMSVPPRWQVMETEVRSTLAAIQGGDNARFIAIARLKDLNRPSLREFYVINNHFPTGGDWTDPTPSAETLESRERWTFHFEAVRAEITRIKNLDHTILWGGDFNRNDASMPKLADNEKQAVGAFAIDKLYALDRGVDTDLNGTGKIVTPYSDHDCRWAKWAMANRP